eukprot:1327189-Pyramimonas_sp.AAC.1
MIIDSELINFDQFVAPPNGSLGCCVHPCRYVTTGTGGPRGLQRGLQRGAGEGYRGDCRGDLSVKSRRP